MIEPKPIIPQTDIRKENFRFERVKSSNSPSPQRIQKLTIFIPAKINLWVPNHPSNSKGFKFESCPYLSLRIEIKTPMIKDSHLKSRKRKIPNKKTKRKHTLPLSSESKYLPGTVILQERFS